MAGSIVLRAHGGVWYKKHREASEVLHTLIDTEARWTKRGWRGWIYGGKLHLLTVVADVELPLTTDRTPANVDDSTTAAQLLRGNHDDLPWAVRTPANVGDSTTAAQLLRGNHDDLPCAVRYLLGDQHYIHPCCTPSARCGTGVGGNPEWSLCTHR